MPFLRGTVIIVKYQLLERIIVEMLNHCGRIWSVTADIFSRIIIMAVTKKQWIFLAALCIFNIVSLFVYFMGVSSSVGHSRQPLAQLVRADSQ